MIKRVVVRSLILYWIGFFLHFLPAFVVTRVDWFGVLQRIAMVYLASSLLFLFTKHENATGNFNFNFNYLLDYTVLLFQHPNLQQEQLNLDKTLPPGSTGCFLHRKHSGKEDGIPKGFIVPFLRWQLA